MSLLTPHYWKKAQRELSRRDPVLGKIIRRYKDDGLASRGRAHYTLSRSIVGQQISVKAADAVWLRLEERLKNITPQAMLDADRDMLRACGLSARKAEYLHAISAQFVDRLERYDWHGASDDEIIETLCTIKGVGRWTAEMFLIFHLMRPDVFPLTDIGVQKGVERLYNGGDRLTLSQIAAIAENWRPYRTVGSWYMWRLLDPVTVTY